MRKSTETYFYNLHGVVSIFLNKGTTCLLQPTAIHAFNHAYTSIIEDRITNIGRQTTNLIIELTKKRSTPLISFLTHVQLCTYPKRKVTAVLRESLKRFCSSSGIK